MCTESNVSLPEHGGSAIAYSSWLVHTMLGVDIQCVHGLALASFFGW